VITCLIFRKIFVYNKMNPIVPIAGGMMLCCLSSSVTSFMMGGEEEIPTDNDDPGDASTPDASTPDASTPVASTPVDSTPPPPSGWCTGNRKKGKAPHRRDHCKTITSQSDCLSSVLTYQSQWDDFPYSHAQICKWNPNTNA
jgi:hypothetical protein